jgi:hypothetical protein
VFACTENRSQAYCSPRLAGEGIVYLSSQAVFNSGLPGKLQRRVPSSFSVSYCFMQIGFFLAWESTLKMRAARFSETSLTYQTTQYHIPEYNSIQRSRASTVGIATGYGAG